MLPNGNGTEKIKNTWFMLMGQAAAVASLPILGYLGLTVINVQSDVRVLNATITLGMNDRYRGSDAGRDFKIRDLEIETLKQRVSELERKQK